LSLPPLVRGLSLWLLALLHPRPHPPRPPCAPADRHPCSDPPRAAPPPPRSPYRPQRPSRAGCSGVGVASCVRSVACAYVSCVRGGGYGLGSPMCCPGGGGSRGPKAKRAILFDSSRIHKFP